MVPGTVYQTTVRSTGILFKNMVSVQQRQSALALAASDMGVMQVYNLDTVADVGVAEKVDQPGVTNNLTSPLVALKSFT